MPTLYIDDYEVYPFYYIVDKDSYPYKSITVTEEEKSRLENAQKESEWMQTFIGGKLEVK